MTRNYLKGAIGDHINLLMAAGHFLALFPGRKLQIYRIPRWKFKLPGRVF